MGSIFEASPHSKVAMLLSVTIYVEKPIVLGAPGRISQLYVQTKAVQVIRVTYCTVPRSVLMKVSVYDSATYIKSKLQYCRSCWLQWVTDWTCLQGSTHTIGQRVATQMRFWNT